MAEFKQLLLTQKTEIDELQRLMRNYEHDSPCRKNMKYLKDKVKTFGDLYRVINANNDELEKGRTADEPYFKDDIFNQLRKRVESIMLDIKQRINAPEPTPKVIPPAPAISETQNIGANSLPNTDDFNIVSPSQPTNVTFGQPINLADEEAPTTIDNTASGSDVTENNNDGADEDNIQLQNTSLNVSIDMMSSDILILQYEEMMDMLAAARDLNENSSHGSVCAVLDNLKLMWTEFRTSIYKSKTEGKELTFSYNLLLQRYMSTNGKLNDILMKPNKSIAKEASSNIQFSLPKIKLPEFSGKPSDWKGFIALFDRMVHNNTNMDNGLKIEFLKTRVKGEASKIISHLDPTPENYSTCYALIRKRYDNKRESLGIWIDNIFNFPKMNKENSDALKSMHDTVYESIMSIQNAGISTANWDALLCHVLTKKQ